MGKQEKWKEYLAFSGRDRLGIGLLLVIIGLVFFLPRILPPSPPAMPVFSDSMLAFVRHPEAEPDMASETDRPFPRDRTASPDRSGKPVLFRFDPNTLSEAGWLQLGLRPKTVRTIRNYLQKGGRFRKAEDLQKIWGLSPSLAAQLMPWVDLPEAGKPEVYTEKAPGLKQAALPERKKLLVEINAADTSAFIALPGIGSKLAARIVSYRDKLGGFCSVQQLREVYGIADSVFQRIEPMLQLSGIPLKRIRINEAGFDELKAHPYFRYELAKAVIAYRNAHGAFRKPEELKQVTLITEEVFRKIAPYISCE